MENKGLRIHHNSDNDEKWLFFFFKASSDRTPLSYFRSHREAL